MKIRADEEGGCIYVALAHGWPNGSFNHSKPFPRPLRRKLSSNCLTGIADWRSTSGSFRALWMVLLCSWIIWRCRWRIWKKELTRDVRFKPDHRMTLRLSVEGRSVQLVLRLNLQAWMILLILRCSPQRRMILLLRIRRLIRLMLTLQMLTTSLFWDVPGSYVRVASCFFGPSLK